MLVMKFIMQSLILLICPTFLTAQCVTGNCLDGKGKYKFENGSIYSGQFSDGKLNGKGTMRYHSGDIYTGMWEDNKKNGGGKFERSNGNIYEGQFVNGKLNGKGRLLYKSKDRYVGTFIDNVPNGKGKIYFKNGNKYEGDVVSGKMHGEGSMIYKNGNFYKGAWNQNKKHGNGFFQFASGKHVEGVWVDGKRDKTKKAIKKEEDTFGAVKFKALKDCTRQYCNNEDGVFSYSDGTRYIGPFKNGGPNGDGRVEYANGDVYEGGWKHHLPDGYGVMKFKNGYTYATIWTNGVAGEMMSNNVNSIAKENYMPIQNSDEVKIWAMVIGISSYNHMPTLRFTDDDAYQFYAFLKSPEGGAVPDDQISILIDEDASKNKILTSMETLFKKADDNDVVLMYFSGHGLDGSFVPNDFDGYNNAIAHQDILTLFENSNAKHKICIADACHSGSLMASRSMTSDLENYYDSFDKSSSGTALILSSKKEEVSLEYKGLRQGVFSHFLIRGLKGEANQNQDKMVSVEELYNFVSTNVSSYTNQMQNPTIAGDFSPLTPIAMIR